MNLSSSAAPQLRLGAAGRRLIASLLVVLGFVSLGGSTVARGALVVAFAAAIAVVTGRSRGGRIPRWPMALGGALAVVGVLHIVGTSRFIATLYDGHMTPSWMLPSSPIRLMIAWSATALWSGTLAVLAVHRPLLKASALGAAALLPFVVGDAFPRDAYWLLWDTSVFGSWPYTTGAAALAVTIVLDRDGGFSRPGERSKAASSTAD